MARKNATALKGREHQACRACHGRDELVDIRSRVGGDWLITISPNVLRLRIFKWH